MIASVFLNSCNQTDSTTYGFDAQYFHVIQSDSDSLSIISISPFDGAADTLLVDGAVNSVICMSSTTVAAFCEIGRADVVKGVSGKRYISNPSIAENPDVKEVGFESSIDFEAILETKPDLILYYKVSSVEPPYVEKLRSLGLRVFPLYDNFEHHPLARAEYIRFCGAVTGESHAADSVFAEVKSSYESLVSLLPEKTKVLVNVPYGDAWYIPSTQSYFSRLIEDAGGEILGARDGTVSSIISLEQAYEFARRADIWLNTGSARNRDELASMNPSFKNFLRDDLRVYNNTLRMTPEGGNDFYERGAVRPDLVLKDLCQILSGEIVDDLEYYIEVK